MKTHLLTAALLAAIVTPTAADDAVVKWVRVTEQAEWQPRDSSVELVFRDRLWIMGGWFDSWEAPPRDVWNSADGKSWQQVSEKAPWRHSDFAMAVSFRDQMLVTGGWYNGRLPGHSASNEVWVSKNGVDWRQLTDNAGWSPRIAGGLVVFKDKLWLLGGTENYYFGDNNSLKNDVWSSVDGITWQLETADAGWTPRAYHQAVVHNGRIYVLGGGNYVPEYSARNDVWSSEDGVHWVQETESAPWQPRIWFSSVVYQDRIWVLGGWSNHPSTNRNDVWYSRDGKEWTQLESEVVWKPRHEHSTFVFQDRIWVAGGHASPLSSEVWSLKVSPNDLSP